MKTFLIECAVRLGQAWNMITLELNWILLFFGSGRLVLFSIENGMICYELYHGHSSDVQFELDLQLNKAKTPDWSVSDMKRYPLDSSTV